MTLIPDYVFEKYYSITDSLNNELGVECTLYYIPSQEVCTNCEQNPLTGKSLGVYKSGGPISFTDTICPYCNGEGFRYTEVSETITMRCYFEKSSWMKLPIIYSIPNLAVQTYGFIADLPKCKRAKSISINVSQAGYGDVRYVLAGEPVLHGLKKSNYFIAMWSQQKDA